MDFYNDDITLSGTVTANNFVGSGSGLTGITANVWNGGTVTGETIFTNTLTAATTTVSRLTVNTPAIAGNETLQRWQITDADAYVRIENGTTTPSTFIPLLAFYQPTLSGVTAGAIQGRGIDGGSIPMLTLGSRTTANTALVNRPVLRISNFTTNIMEFIANGNVGINTTAPTERLDVNGSIRTRNSIIFSDTTKYISGGVAAVLEINSGTNSMTFRGTSTSFMRGTQAGGVGIEITTGTTSINSSAILTLTSTEKGFLPPRMTTAQRNLIASPAAGLVIYNTDVNSLQTYNGSTWDSLIPSTFTGGTVSGATTFTGGLSATSISATTIVGPQPYTLSVQALTSTPTDSATIYFGQLPKAPTTTANISKVFIPKSGTIKRAMIYCYAGTAGTAENWSANIRLNNTTDTLIETIGASTNERIFNNESLNITVVAGDYIEIKMVNPLWATNPATAIFGGYIYIE